MIDQFITSDFWLMAYCRKPLRTCLNDLKTVISISVIKMFRKPCSCERGRIAKKWEKVVENDEKYFD